MKIAVAIWEDRISPVFDSSQKIGIFEIHDGSIYKTTEESLTDTSYQEKIDKLLHLQIKVLICGAISRPLACWIEATGIDLHSFITGLVEDVLTAYVAEQLDNPIYQMPGCCYRYKPCCCQTMTEKKRMDIKCRKKKG